MCFLHFNAVYFLHVLSSKLVFPPCFFFIFVLCSFLMCFLSSWCFLHLFLSFLCYVVSLCVFFKVCVSSMFFLHFCVLYILNVFSYKSVLPPCVFFFSMLCSFSICFPSSWCILHLFLFFYAL